MEKQLMYHHLPVDAYTSSEWFAREQERIFSRTWAYAGLAEDVAEPGQYVSVQAGLNNLFIVMGRDHRLRAFHNICRHRGTQLLRAVGKTAKALTCPYHDWTYDLEGKLISIPEEQTEYSGVDKTCLGLKPAAVEKWRGMLWVHPDPDAGAGFMQWFGAVDAHLGPHQPEALVEYTEARRQYEVKANWKVIVENYIDVYHLRHLHAGTLHMYEHAKAEYAWHGPHFSFWEPPADIYAKDQESKLSAPRVIAPELNGAWVPMLFPGIGLAGTEDSWSVFIITPLAPNLTRVENRVKLADASYWEFVKQGWASHKFWSDFARPKYQPEDSSGDDDPMASADFTREDIYACEQQQKSFYSPHFEVGPAAKSESPVVTHQRVVLDFLERK